MRQDYATRIERDEQGRSVRLALYRVQGEGDMVQGAEPGSVASLSEYSHVGPFVACACGCGLDVPPTSARARHARLYATDACRARTRNRRIAEALSRQRALPLEPPPAPVPPVVDQRVPVRERRRLGGMSLRIVGMLRANEQVSNREFSASFPPGSAWRTRVSDARLWLEARGETIRCKVEPGGLAWYWLEDKA